MLDRELDWWELVEGEYRLLSQVDEAGVLESRGFPGLHMACGALLEGNLAAVLAELQRGLGESRHAEFAARLMARREQP